MKVHEALADAFAGEGVNAIFGVMGDGNMYWMAALEKHPQIRMYDVRHEGAGLAMADGWARVTGQPGVCTVTNGPGLAQLSTSMIVANRNRTPIVIFAGDRPEGDSHHQVLNQQRFVEGSEGGFVRIPSPDAAHDAVRKAFYRARTESRPIVLDAPMDIQAMDYDGPEEYVPSTAILPPAQRITPDAEQLERAARAIAASKKPVIVVGRGAIASDAGAAVVRLAERIGAVIATSLLAKGYLAEQPYHAGIAGLYATGAATHVFTEADCVIGVGASLNNYTIEAGYLFVDAQFIQIDVQPQVVLGSGKVADCYLQGDGRDTVEAIDRLLAKSDFSSTGLRTPAVDRLLRAKIDDKPIPLDPGCVDPREVCRLLDERLSAEVGLIVGFGHSSAFSTMLINRPRWPTIAGKPFGCIGQAMGVGIGAAVASKRPTLIIDGDSSIMMHIQELDTIRRYGLPILIVILNDEALGSEYHKFVAEKMNDKLAQVSSPDMGAIARGFGFTGHLARSLDELATAVEAFDKNPQPTFVDVRVSRTVPSLPYRRLHFGEADELPETAASGAAAS